MTHTRALRALINIWLELDYFFINMYAHNAFHFFAEKTYKLVNVKHKSRNQRSVRDVIHLRLNTDDGSPLE